MKRFKIQEDLNAEITVCGIQDENGQPFQVTDSVKDNLPKKIRVTLEATHTGVNRNKVEYTHFGLEQSVDSWTRDYHKPVLLNHNTHSDPLGRVLSAEYKQSVIDASKNCIQLTLEITNAAAIERFLDGRYRTFSIGGYTDSAKCSICGKDQMKDGWCGHSRGRKYADKECYWTLGQMDYDEISVVNCPADPQAQALSIDIVNTEEGKGTDGANPIVPPITDGVDDGLGLSHIDGILGNQGEGAGDEGNEPPADPQTDGAQEPPATEPDTTKQGWTDEEHQEALQKLQDEIDRLNADIILKDELISEKDSKITTLEETIATKEADNTALQTQLDAANEDAKGLVKQNVGLARLAHKIMCQRAVDVQLAVGDVKEEDKDSLMKEYATYTTQKLEDLIQGLFTPAKITERAKVQHPGTAQINDDTTTTSASGGNPTMEPTLDEYIEEVTKFFVGKM